MVAFHPQFHSPFAKKKKSLYGLIRWSQFAFARAMLLLYHSSVQQHVENALHRHAGGFVFCTRGTLRALYNATLAVLSFCAPGTLKTL